MSCFLRLQEMEENTQQLEKRLDSQTSLLRAQLEEKEQRILFLTASAEYTTRIVQRNSELENLISTLKSSTQGIEHFRCTNSFLCRYDK